MNTETLAYRVEWNNKGPFFDDLTYTTVTKLCRKLVPEYKQRDVIAPTLFDHYVANAESPYENKIMCRFLEGYFVDGEIGFGFVDIYQLGRSLGLRESIYAKQFVAMCKQKEFRLKIYLVNPIASTRNQVMFKWASAELVEEYAANQIVDLVSEEFTLKF